MAEKEKREREEEGRKITSFSSLNSGTEYRRAKLHEDRMVNKARKKADIDINLDGSSKFFLFTQSIPTRDKVPWKLMKRPSEIITNSSRSRSPRRYEINYEHARGRTLADDDRRQIDRSSCSKSLLRFCDTF